MRFCDLNDETRIVPFTERFVCCHVDRSFSFRARDGDGEIRLTGRAVNVRVSRYQKSLFDRRPENLDHGRMRLSSGQSVFVNVGRFHRAEHDQRDRDNKSDEQC